MVEGWDQDDRARFLASFPGEDARFDGLRFGQGDCIGCGLLARRGLDRPVAEEVPPDDRAAGSLLSLADGSPSIPWCLVHKANLVDETEEAVQRSGRIPPIPASGLRMPYAKKRHTPDDVQWLETFLGSDVLMRNRKCPEWYPYREFMSPAEHRQERDMMRLEHERQQLLVRLADMESAARTRQADADDRFRRAERRWSLIVVGFAAASVFVQLFYPNGLDIERTLELIESWWPF